jgi:hypothetical protein
MNETIFISCGQYSPPEKQLGKDIAELVEALTGLRPFFAEIVQDLNGLDANILEALRNCVAFITVLHPRGNISRPDGSGLVRASVWIEQEIAIATYIQRAEKRSLPIIAFKHKSVGLEGIRSFLQVNPIEFTDESEVLAALRTRLLPWKSLKPAGVELLLTSTRLREQDEHVISKLETTLVNNTNDLVEKYQLEVRLPTSILMHWNSKYPSEVNSNEPGLRCFRFDQSGFGAIRPRDRRRLATFEYCTKCAVDHHYGVAALVSEAHLGARVWIGGKEYTTEKTIKQLAIERAEN